jgi:MFS family permease
MSDARRARETDAAPSRLGGIAAWAAVLLLCVAQIVSTADRGMLALVVDAVRADLGVSDVQIAVLQGFAFSVFYVIAGIALGMVADRVNRKRLLLAGMIVWSAATIASGLAQSFAGMLGARLFIGIGEAVLAPCAVTIISDLFPASRRGRPMALYVFGSIIAFGVASIATGAVLQAAPHGAFAWIAPLKGLPPWRVAFVLAGAAGVGLASFTALLREPRRKAAALGEGEAADLRSGVGYMLRRWPLFLSFYGALAFFGMGVSVVTNWGAMLLTRVYGFSLAQASQLIGAGQIGWAVLGSVIAAVAIDGVARTWGAAGKLRFGAALSLAAVPSTLAVLAPGGHFAGLLVTEVTFAASMFGTTMLSLIAEIAPARVRGLSVSLYSFFMTLIGASLGPVFVAFLTQSVFGSPQAVGISMALVGTSAFLAAGALSATAAGRVRGLTVSGPAAASDLASAAAAAASAPPALGS